MITHTHTHTDHLIPEVAHSPDVSAVRESENGKVYCCFTDDLLLLQYLIPEVANSPDVSAVRESENDATIVIQLSAPSKVPHSQQRCLQKLRLQTKKMS